MYQTHGKTVQFISVCAYFVAFINLHRAVIVTAKYARTSCGLIHLGGTEPGLPVLHVTYRWLNSRFTPAYLDLDLPSLS